MDVNATNKEFGDWLISQRHRFHVSKKLFVKRAGLKYSEYTRWENGEYGLPGSFALGPSRFAVKRICQALASFHPPTPNSLKAYDRLLDEACHIVFPEDYAPDAVMPPDQFEKELIAVARKFPPLFRRSAIELIADLPQFAGFDADDAARDRVRYGRR